MAFTSPKSDALSSQFAVLSSIRRGSLVPSFSATVEERKEDQTRLHSKMDELLPDWPFKWNKRTPPCQVHVPSATLDLIQKLNVALNKACVNIIERWFDDHEANFPQRMPVSSHEEQALKWIAGPGRRFVPPFRDHQGIARPDFLHEYLHREDDSIYENIRICEINSRLPFNGTMLTYYTYKVYESYDLPQANLEFTISPDILLSSLFSLFDTSLPVHGVVDKAAFLGEIYTFSRLFEKTFNKPFKIIKPTDLRLIPDETSQIGFSVYSVVQANEKRKDTIEHDGQILEPVFQLALSLFQEEYEAWDFNMMCQISTQCPVNDFRTTFLLNDQRFLGIILEELDNLVNAQHAITVEEAACIRDGVVPTILCSSAHWDTIEGKCKLDPAHKDGWVIKSGRSGIGHGHVFGNSVSNEEWLAKLMLIKTSGDLAETAFCLQRHMKQGHYDIIRHNIEEEEGYHLVGSYLTVHGMYRGLSIYRIARQTLIRISEPHQGLVMYAFKTGG